MLAPLAPWSRLDSVAIGGPAAVIGDIHGRRDLLAKLLDELPPKTSIFTIGDVNDRGPDTQGVIELLVQRGARGVRGNHEVWLCDLIDGQGFDAAAKNPLMGGLATLDSYRMKGRTHHELADEIRKIPLDHRAWLQSLPAAMHLTVDGVPFWLVHAGVSLSHAASLDPQRIMRVLAGQKPHDLLWRSQRVDAMDALDAPVIFGHVPRDEPIDAGHAIGIDTGCGTRPNGRLTAVLLPSRRFITVGE